MLWVRVIVQLVGQWFFRSTFIFYIIDSQWFISSHLFMLSLVIVCNFTGVFVGWEGAGFRSYLLINFRSTGTQSNKIAIKVTVLNRIKYFGLVTSILIIFVEYKAADYVTVFTLAPVFTGKFFNLRFWFNFGCALFHWGE